MGLGIQKWPSDFQQGHQDHSVEKKWSLQQMVLGQLDIHMQKSEFGTLPPTIYKNLPKVNQWSKYKG